MKDTKKNIRRVFWLYFCLVVLLQSYLIKYILFDSKNIITSPYNPRLTLLEKDIKRGEILDSNEVVLATSIKKDGKYDRVYQMGKEFVHLLGNINHQKSGVEVKYNFKMQNLTLGIIQRAKNIMFDSELKGDNVVLTIDSRFQKFVYNILGNNKGAIVAIEPSTGKILSMVSFPNYDPNNIKNDWQTLNKDTENSPLVNRASSGLYAPGSVFKIVSSLMIMRNIPNYKDIIYECTGEETINNITVSCIDKKAHGTVDLDKAIAYSCNSFFSYYSTQSINDNFKKLAESLYFNKGFNFPLEYNKSSFVLDNNSNLAETMQTSIGQGKTLMTPLHIAMITSAVANGGIMMEPYILDYIETSNGKQKKKTIPKMLNQVMTLQESVELNKMMWDVVTYGTGKSAAIFGIEIAGKTGTAQNSTDKDHGLFTCFAPSENADIVVTVVLEESGKGGSNKATIMARDIVNYYLNNIVSD